MCGIAGILDHAPREVLRDIAASMGATLSHRGPDGSGVWDDEGIALAHQRLAIVDLAETGAQPMVSASGRYVLAYNGEVYGFAALRSVLESRGHRFRGGSDTEVVLAAFEEWGVSRAVHRFVGMFAFALWDREERRLTLGRDRLGIKPLYVGHQHGRLFFGSELRALAKVPDFDATIDRDALALYFRYACLPGGRCIYAGVEQVSPGELWHYGEDEREPRREVYWDARAIAEQGLAEPLDVSFEAAVERTDAVLRKAVAERMVADVPLGVFLSGGIDSSTIAALMQAESSAPIRSFSIGFDDAAYDEGQDAARVAHHLGTAHTAFTLTPEDAMKVVPELGSIYDEPFADSSQLPTLLVCRLAREEVTVTLSGDGGDEAFGGYNRHVWAPRIWAALRASPRAVRHQLAKALRSRSPASWDAFASRHRRWLPLLNVRQPGDKTHKLAGLLETERLDELYLALTSIWRDPTRIVPGARDRPATLPRLDDGGVSERLMLADLLGYLPDDILTKVDRASMSTSLEVRVPLLDHRLIELAWRLPVSHKISKGVGKRVLRGVLQRYVPPALFERPKIGFGVPIDRWLRGPLRPWAEDLLHEGRLRRDGFLDPTVVRACWSQHLEGHSARQHELWAALMFQAWLDARR